MVESCVYAVPFTVMVFEDPLGVGRLFSSGGALEGPESMERSFWGVFACALRGVAVFEHLEWLRGVAAAFSGRGVGAVEPGGGIETRVSPVRGADSQVTSS